MSFTNWLSERLRLYSRRRGPALRPASRRKRLAQRPSFRPKFDELEDRVVPSSLDSLYIGDGSDSTVKQFDAATGAYERTIVTSGSGGLTGPRGLIFSAGHLLVNDQSSFYTYNTVGDVLSYDGQTGAFEKALVSRSDGHDPFNPRGICAGPNHSVIIGDLGDLTNALRTGTPGRVSQFDEKTGAWLRDLVPPSNDPFEFGYKTNDPFKDTTNGPKGVVIGPDGNLYVAVRTANGLGGEVMRFNPVTGNFIDDFVVSNSANDLNRPEGLAFGPDGNLYVTSFSADSASAKIAVTDTDKILEFSGPLNSQFLPGTYLGKIDLEPLGQARTFAQALLFGPEGKLFVPITGNDPNHTGEVRRCDVSTGKYDVFIPPPVSSVPGAPVGPIGQAWFLIFGNTDPATLDYEAPSLSLDRSSLDLGTTTYGTAGTTAAFAISGNALAGNVLITAPSGVELSTDGLIWSTSLTLTPSSPTLASTTIDVRISAGDSAGNLSGVIQDTSSGANEVDVSLSGAIKPATLTVTPTAGQSKTYGDPVPKLSYTADGFVNNDPTSTLTGSLGTTATAASPVGNYTFTTDALTAGPNYTVVLAANAPTFAVTPATLTVTADAESKVYGSADPALTYAVKGYQLSDTAATVLSGSLTRDPGETVLGGPYAIKQGKLTANTNYTIAFTGNVLAITPATLTVTADPQTKVYGSADPALTYTVSGFQFSDTAMMVLSGSLTRVAGETVLGGPYAIKQGTLAANTNYTIAFTGDSLTITPATPTVQVTDAGGTYNQSPFAATATVAGVDQIPGPNLENVAPSLTYYSGSMASGLALGSAPILPGTYTVAAVFAGSPDYTSASATTTFTIKTPTTSITGPTIGVPGQPLTYTFAVNGPTKGITFSVDYGDGASLKTNPDGPSIKLDHPYTAPGSFTIQVTATDKNNVTSQLATQKVNITQLAMETDPSGGTALAVGGNAAGGDTISVSATDTTGKAVNVTVNGASFGTFTPTGHIFVYGQGGKDKIMLKPYVVGNNTYYYIKVPAFLYGEGSGGDKISALGSASNNVLTGNGSNEVLTGGQGRDLLIGGTGAATINAGVQDDILIGGWTDYDIGSAGMTYDQKLATLNAIVAEWGSADSYATRLNALAVYLNTYTVHDNYQNGVAIADQLLGNAKANDWFFAGINDYVGGSNLNDVITTLK
jgi:hypothetical protein